jgi:hypothetical protein
MNQVKKAIDYLRIQGFDTVSIMDALCDGEALESMGLEDEDQEDIEAAFSELKTSLAGMKGTT